MTIEQVDQTVVTKEPARSTGRMQRSRRITAAAPPRTGPSGPEMTRRIIILGFGLIQILIGARIVLLLLDAREANVLVSAILSVSQWFVAPFEGILRTDSLNSAGSQSGHRRDRRPRRLDRHRARRPVGRGHLPPRPGMTSVLRSVALIAVRSVILFVLPATLVAAGPDPRHLPKGTHQMGFIAWIVVGAVAGFLASKIMGASEGSS